jgi:hypothetical protein
MELVSFRGLYGKIKTDVAPCGPKCWSSVPPRLPVPEENGDRYALLGAHQDVIIGRCGTERRRFDDQIDGERPRGVPANLADQFSQERWGQWPGTELPNAIPAPMNG